ncbi:guanylate cyclase [Leptospira kmetyi]|uniref:Ammonium transporter n=1 Tax=Leptospira kmetyi TaxID=408139 RepID=A0A2M9XUR8_9LEPT|nr:ammonium transporter [Leptospira kmetyi]AYV54050.1 ammonium transporter [Leptospira kmetyi]AYV57298.1 ammonium transporter [Leptospira kmetyi]EQA53744.1 ammonium transporter [Leptospira kmetyi serovar Malaysia str. Bejo-Iso9]PJZ43027.1 guanylate cyclase [Leptospira kmetyi]TGK21341.1 ammonium transporter [Leptospira kmetyi]
MPKTNFDILWIILSSGLVFFMQAGFLCLESGLTRTKNSINVAIKNITDFGIATLIFYAVGFGLMFGKSVNGIFGADTFFPEFSTQDPNVAVFFLFQLMFCGTAATIVSGAVAERMKFGAYIVVTAVISALIYPIFGHWVWGKDLTQWEVSTGWLGRLGFIDFAGSTVVHSVGGWVGLAAMKILGNRSGKYGEDGSVRNITGHNLPLAMLGTLILWLGWIGFNGGSTLAFTAAVPKIIVNTMFAAVSGMASSLIYGWIRLQYAEATLPLNGALAGLVAITASCHAVSSIDSVIIGFIAGILMFETRSLLDRIKIDDAVGAIPVHLAAGVWGTLAVGIFGNPEILGNGLGHIDQIQVQLIGIVSCGALAFGLSYILLSIINKFFPFRVSEQNEYKGLNYTEHRATTELIDLFLEMEYQKRTGDLSKDLSIEPFTEVGQIAERYNSVLGKIRLNIREKEILAKELEDNLNLIQSDLSTAKKIQSGIISHKDRTLGELEVIVRYLPLSEVGGDFFDIMELKPGLTRVFLADATGHGVQAALITMAIKAIYESLKRGIYSVTEILYHLNNEFLHTFKNLNQFFTCIVLDIDTNSGNVRYASAGHIPQYLIGEEGIQKLEKTGRIVGAISKTQYTSKDVKITPNSKLVLFTDGLVEQWNVDKEEFGEERVENLIHSLNTQSIRDGIDSLLSEQEKFLSGVSKQDDISVIGINWKRA